MNDKTPKNIMFDSINVQSISACSGIFIGENVQYEWETHGKVNSGAGSMTGDYNIMVRVFNVVYDNDWIDFPKFGNGNGNGNNEENGENSSPASPPYFC